MYEAKQIDQSVATSSRSLILPMNRIIQGDCESVLKAFPDDSIDLIVTSPPYGENRKKTYQDISIVGEQGDVLGRKGRVTIELTTGNGSVTSVRIGGRAVTVLSGDMLIG